MLFSENRRLLTLAKAAIEKFVIVLVRKVSDMANTAFMACNDASRWKKHLITFMFYYNKIFSQAHQKMGHYQHA